MGLRALLPCGLRLFSLAGGPCSPFSLQEGADPRAVKHCRLVRSASGCGEWSEQGGQTMSVGRAAFLSSFVF